MADSWEPILLSAKVFGHISQGLYRTPAGAIKELISNAFDADATLTRIHTDFPRFETLSCEDNGIGMSSVEFKRLMNRGIGASYKRDSSSGETKVHRRPLIGRLGLGILSLAQICTEFDVIAHHKDSKSAFRATIQFLPYTREEMDRITESAEDNIEGGKYNIELEEYDSSKQGLKIFTAHLREQFRKRMKSTLQSSANKRLVGSIRPYKTFDEFLAAIYNPFELTLSLNACADYDQLVFGLALAPPLPLVEGRNLALNLPMVRERQATLKKYDFEVQVDNCTLAHPVYLPSDRDGHTAMQCHLKDEEVEEFELIDGAWKEKCKVKKHNVAVEKSDVTFRLYELEYSKPNVAGRPLAFNGYLVQQIGRLYPRDIQGILIRLNNVAIGKYDSTMMEYPRAEGPRYSMVSGELFILRGFDDALNIDRDSFNELHPHYIRTQAYIHNLLHDLLFPETWEEEKKRNRKRREKAERATRRQFLQSYRKITGEKVDSIEFVEKKRTEESKRSGDTPVEVKSRGREIKIDKTHPLLQPVFRRRKYAPLVEKLVIAFERANLEGGASARRELFYSLLAEIFSE